MGFHLCSVLMFFMSSSVGAVLEVVCVSDVSDQVAICSFMFEVSYIITYSLSLKG
jgi:hypothetical protein